MGNAESRRTGMPAGAFWHSDQSYAAKPSDAIFLYSSRVPRIGGDTLVANMALAYDALPVGLKQRIAGRTAIHRYGYRGGEAITPLTPQQQARMIDAEHPVVRVHPISGRKILYISPGYTVRITGMEATESEELLEQLFEHSHRPEFQYRHKWRANQLLGVDNRATMHCAVADYTEARRMLRMLVAGTESQVDAALAP
jgi:taurine dioxygenase